MQHQISITTRRHKSGWTYQLDVENAGTYETDRCFITRQAAIEAASLRLLRELPVMIAQDLIEPRPSI